MNDLIGRENRPKKRSNRKKKHHNHQPPKEQQSEIEQSEPFIFRKEGNI